VTALDEPAVELLDPEGCLSPRGLRPVTEEVGPVAPEFVAEQGTLDAVDSPSGGRERQGEARVIEAEIPPAREDDTAEMPRARADTAQDAQPRSSRKRKDHPIVPAWEDVLLGVRSQRG
jgi:hypothetical protein